MGHRTHPITVVEFCSCFFIFLLPGLGLCPNSDVQVQGGEVRHSSNYSAPRTDLEHGFFFFRPGVNKDLVN